MFNGVLSGSGDLIIDVKSSTINSANTYTGETTVVSNGELYLRNENALGNSGTRGLNLKNGGSVAPADVLSLAGANPTPIVLDGGGRIFFDSNSVDFATVIEIRAINSDISGTGGLVVDVLNLRNNANEVVDVTFGGNNTYDGATTLRTTGKPTVANPGFHRLIARNGLADALPTTTVLEFDNRTGNGSARQTISYDLNGFSQEVAGLKQVANQATVGFLDANAVVNSSGTAATLTVNNSTDYTFDGWLGVDNYTGPVPQAFPAVGNNFGLTKSGGGTLTLTADNSYAGATQVDGGVLALGAGGAIDDSSAIGIAAGASLDVTALSSYTMLAGQPLTLDIDPTGLGVAGLLDATGTTLDITNGDLMLNLLGTLDDSAYVLFNYGTLNQGGGDFDSVAPSGYAFDYAFNGGTQIALVADAVVPEPASIAIWGIIGLGLACFGYYRTRRKQ